MSLDTLSQQYFANVTLSDLGRWVRAISKAQIADPNTAGCSWGLGALVATVLCGSI